MCIGCVQNGIVARTLCIHSTTLGTPLRSGTITQTYHPYRHLPILTVHPRTVPLGWDTVTKPYHPGRSAAHSVTSLYQGILRRRPPIPGH